MSKRLRIVGMLTALVLIITLLCSCGLFTDNPKTVGGKEAFTIAGESISLYTFQSAFSANVNNYGQSLYESYQQQYASYISAGYITMDEIYNMVYEEVFNYTYDQILNAYSLIALYKKNAPTIYNNTLSAEFDYAKYLVEATDGATGVIDEIGYVLKASKSSLLSALISNLTTIIKEEGYTIEDDDDDDDDNETNIRADQPTVVIDSFVSEDYGLDTESIDEFLIKYSPDTTGNFNLDYTTFIDDFLLPVDNTSLIEQYQYMVDHIELKDTQTVFTIEQFVAYRTKAYNQLELTIKSNFNGTINEFIKNLIDDNLKNALLIRIERQFCLNLLEGNQSEMITRLNTYLAEVIDMQKISYTLDIDNYRRSVVSSKVLDGTKKSIVGGLTNDSYISYVPDGEDQFIFVKNLLIPFSSEQQAQLTAIGKAIGAISTDNNGFAYKTDVNKDAYQQYRLRMASEILAENFVDENAPLEKFFYIDAGELQINPTLDSLLKSVSNADEFLDLMYKYNTDTAQHTSTFDYVANGDPESGFESAWVTEFQEGCELLYDNGDLFVDNDTVTGTGGIAIAVTDFGVHFIYYVGKVTAHTFDFDTTNNLYYTKGTQEYNLLHEYYRSITEGAYELYYTTALDEVKDDIIFSDYFIKWIKANGFEVPDNQ
ncbi:MAG: hypothetical protein PHW00_00240 [Clostridia bacterium]|nr:hypothetical protein [Clostridia bacterium]